MSNEFYVKLTLFLLKDSIYSFDFFEKKKKNMKKQYLYSFQKSTEVLTFLIIN